MEIKPAVPRLELLAHASVKIAAPLLLGQALTGERRIIPIAGGRVEGAKLRGEIIPGGADWQIVAGDGTVLLEARYTIRTGDGALVLVRNTGVAHSPPEVRAARARGEEVDPSKYYFRATPIFETGDKRYDWLNRMIFVCSGAPARSEVLLDFYSVM
jgi:hypothetical protein